LAFLPTAAAVAAVFKGENAGAASFALSLFGLAATLGLVTYNVRNDQLYDELVGRAASIERSLGLPDGAFSNRPRPWLTIRLLKVRWEANGNVRQVLQIRPEGGGHGRLVMFNVTDSPKGTPP
jgi:hypothetical protein